MNGYRLPANTAICIPAYNAKESLALLWGELGSIVCADQVLVVDDGSDDATGTWCARTHVPCIAHAHNRGKGAALATGFSYLVEKGYRWVLTLDADGQHPVADIPRFTQQVQQRPSSAIIIGARKKLGSGMPLPRIMSNTLTSIALSFITRRWIPDSQCGFRMYAAAFLEKITIESQRFEVETETILKAHDAGMSLAFVPVQTVYLGTGSHISHLGDMLRWIRAVFKYRTPAA